jgi:hypothetical protein
VSHDALAVLGAMLAIVEAAQFGLILYLVRVAADNRTAIAAINGRLEALGTVKGERG